MKRFLCMVPLLASLMACGQTLSNGASLTGSLQYADSMPFISNVQPSPSPVTIVVTWQTASMATNGLACGLTSGTYNIPALDSGARNGFQQKAIVEGLTASTLYHCKITSTNSVGTQTATLTETTLSTPTTTPITGLTFSSPSPYNSINPNNQCSADTFYNDRSNDGNTYMTNDDTTTGCTQSGSPAASSAASSLMVATSLSPLALKTINYLPAYGPCCHAEPDDGLSQKTSGLFAMGGNLFMIIGRQQNNCCGLGSTVAAYPQTSGQIIWSPDHGISWNNFQSVASFNGNGNITTPPSAAMFGTNPSTFGSATFLNYCGDDGSQFGYLTPCNREDNADAFIYLFANEGVWNGGGTAGGGNDFYLARVPKFEATKLDPTTIQYYKGGTCSLDSSWSNTESDAIPIISNFGELGEASVNYVPLLHRYLLLTFFYPGGLAPSNPQAQNSTWLGYESPTPCGTWTQIASVNWNGPGYYNPIPIGPTLYNSLTPLVIFTGDFRSGGTASYQPYVSTMTILH